MYFYVGRNVHRALDSERVGRDLAEKAFGDATGMALHGETGKLDFLAQYGVSFAGIRAR